MKAEQDMPLNSARAHLRAVKRIEDLDPGIEQGRNQRNPKRDRDIAAMAAGWLLGVSVFVAAGVAMVELIKWAAK